MRTLSLVQTLHFRVEEAKLGKVTLTSPGI